MISLLLSASLSCAGPQGTKLELVGPPNLMDQRAVGLGGGRYFQGFARVYAKPGSWFTIGWTVDSPTAWPAGETLYAVLSDTTIACDELFAMSPPMEQRVLELGRWNQTLRPKDLWRAASGRVKLYVRFPVPMRQSDIRAIELRRR